MNLKIAPTKKVGPHRTGKLHNISVDEIVSVLGFKANCIDDPGKVSHSWGFDVKVDGVIHALGIWSYRGSEFYNQFSTYGPKNIFKMLFGDKAV